MGVDQRGHDGALRRAQGENLLPGAAARDADRPEVEPRALRHSSGPAGRGAGVFEGSSHLHAASTATCVCFTPREPGRFGRRLRPAALATAGRREFGRFYEALNDVYRSSLGRGSFEAPGSDDEACRGHRRVRRVSPEGCSITRRRKRACSNASRPVGRPRCARPQRCITTPCRRRIRPWRSRTARPTVLRTIPGAVDTATHVDPEGEVVWLQVYVARTRPRRARGRRPRHGPEGRPRRGSLRRRVVGSEVLPRRSRSDLTIDAQALIAGVAQLVRAGVS